MQPVSAPLYLFLCLGLTPAWMAPALPYCTRPQLLTTQNKGSGGAGLIDMGM